MNWVHVHNLVQAHMLAAEALTAAKGYVAVSPLQCSLLLLPPPRASGKCPSLRDSWLTYLSPHLKMASGTVGQGSLGRNGGQWGRGSL